MKPSLSAKALFALLAFVSAPYDAWVMWHLWGWFVVPIGGPQISVARTYGLVLLLSCARARYSKDDVWKDLADKAVWMLVTPTIYLALGYVAHLLVRS